MLFSTYINVPSFSSKLKRAVTFNAVWDIWDVTLGGIGGGGWQISALNMDPSIIACLIRTLHCLRYFKLPSKPRDCTKLSLHFVTRINGPGDFYPTGLGILNRTSFMNGGGGGGGSFVGINWRQSPLMWSLTNGWFIPLCHTFCYWQVRFLCDHVPLPCHCILFYPSFQ